LSWFDRFQYDANYKPGTLLLTSYFLLLTSYFLLLKWVMGTLMAQMRADAADSDGC
jgi:hypothetical protein